MRLLNNTIFLNFKKYFKINLWVILINTYIEHNQKKQTLFSTNFKHHKTNYILF